MNFEINLRKLNKFKSLIWLRVFFSFKDCFSQLTDEGLSTRSKFEVETP